MENIAKVAFWKICNSTPARNTLEEWWSDSDDDSSFFAGLVLFAHEMNHHVKSDLEESFMNRKNESHEWFLNFIQKDKTTTSFKIQKYSSFFNLQSLSKISFAWKWEEKFRLHFLRKQKDHLVLAIKIFFSP